MCIALVSQLSCLTGNFSFKKVGGKEKTSSWLSSGYSWVTKNRNAQGPLGWSPWQVGLLWMMGQSWKCIPKLQCFKVLPVPCSKRFICFTIPKDSPQVYLREGTASHLLFRPMKTSTNSTPEVVWNARNHLGRRLAQCGWASLHPWMWLQPNPGSRGNLNIRLLHFFWIMDSLLKTQ